MTKKTSTKPYAIRLADGRIVDHLDHFNASEQVRLYGAAFVDFDAAQIAITAERTAERAQITVNAKDVR